MSDSRGTGAESPSEPPPFEPPPRSWPVKFRDAGRSVLLAFRSQTSFHVQLVVALLVVIAGAVLRVTRIEWCLLLLCVFGVLAAEMLNTALEVLAKAVDRRFNPHLRGALDAASGGVLLAAIGAAVVGAIVLGGRLWEWLQ